MEPLVDEDPGTSGPQDPLLELVYRVGAVARLANIPVETLRVWERRYGIVEHHPGARHRHRFYSLRDVRRLTLIKQLVDLGSSISSVARLPLAQLQQMHRHATAAAVAQPAAPTVSGKLRLVLSGPGLQARFAAAPTRLRSGTVVAQIDALESVGADPVEADVLVVEVDTLKHELSDPLDRALLALKARAAIIAYRFAATEVLDAFALRGHLLHRAPLSIDRLDAVCAVLPVKRDDSPRNPELSVQTPPTPAARFDERTLARIGNMSSSLKCECPRHVTELLLSLSAFEKYSAECADRGPEDAELHAELGRVAAHCRQRFEQALIYLARVEGIALG